MRTFLLRIPPAARYMLLATLCYTTMNVLVKMISHVPAIEVVFFRSLVTLVLSWFILRRQKVSIWGKNRPLLIMRGIFGTTALILFFSTIQNMPLATALLIHYLGPIFTAIIAALVLKERVYFWQWMFFAMSFAGIALIKGFETRISLFFLLIGICSAFFTGAAYNTIRYLKGNEHPVVVVFYFPLIALPFTGFLLLWYWVMPTISDLLMLLAIGGLTQIAQVLMTKAYQIEEASRVAGISYVGVLYGLLFGFLFFGELFSFWVLIGMAMVLTGIILNLSFFTFKKVKTD